MESSAILRSAIFFIILGGSIGFLLGYAYRGRFSDEKSPARTKPEDREDPNKLELLRVWRHKPSGKLIVNLKKAPLPPGAKLNVDQQLEVGRTLQSLQQWMGKEPPPAETPADPHTSPPPAVEAPPPPPPSPTPFADSLPQQVGFREGYKFGMQNPKKKDTDEPQKALSIVEQINDILQSKLSGQPELESEVRLTENPGKGMLIHIGYRTYEFIDEVPDENIRKLIRQSAKEWNDAQSKKLMAGR